jgi:GDPmannose 4,6-dehydratase
MTRKKALITGVTGQDGSYLAELLLEKGYEVHGVVRRSSSFNTKRIDHLYNSQEFNKTFFTHFGDVTDPVVISGLVSSIKPDEIYNLAAQSHVKVSFEIPYYTANVDAVGTLNILEAARNHAPEAKVYQASTSELYGGLPDEMPETGFDETTPFHPRSPYGCAKIYAYWATRNYREAYNMFACNGILFNHESPRRGETFVTRKITLWFAEYCNAIANKKPFTPLQIGNLDAFRDWGHAKDYVEAQWLILQQDKPDDYVIATHEAYSVRNFIDKAFSIFGLQLEWDASKGKDQEVARCNGQIVVQVNPKYYRPSEVPYLLGNPKKSNTILNWKPKYNFEALVEEMVKEDLKQYRKG